VVRCPPRQRAARPAQHPFDIVQDLSEATFHAPALADWTPEV
jgi:hypothetical protein